MSRLRAEVFAAALVLALAPAAARGDDKGAVAAPAERPHVTLTWSTASEVDNFGFFVMRGEDEKGPFKALNDKAVPGAGNSDLPREYRYEDYAVEPGKTYFYYLESVSTSGVHEKFSPVLKRQCCKQVAPKADEKKPAEPAAKPEPKPKS